MKLRRITPALCVAICVVMSGCGAQEEAQIEDNVVESVGAKTQAEAEPPVEKSSAVDALGDETEKELLLATDAFEPPFPDRIELFVSPKRQGRSTKKSADGINNAVELLGFVNVDGQRVVLSINGFVSPLAEGSQEAGIEVISIQPPSVVLQRGRQRWQVNLGY